MRQQQPDLLTQNLTKLKNDFRTHFGKKWDVDLDHFLLFAQLNYLHTLSTSTAKRLDLTLMKFDQTNSRVSVIQDTLEDLKKRSS